ncbi:MAG: GNAT family N-acetyltransferase [Candidatus Sumerlaeia bacterium]
MTRESKTSFICPQCRLKLRDSEDGLACKRCDALYPVCEGIPLLVRDPDEHLRLMEKEIEANPAWYESSQLAWYDHGPCRHHLARRRDYVEAVLEKLGSDSGGIPRLLDLGCGDGANTRWLADYAEEICACDYNLLRLRRCREQIPDEKPSQLCLANLHSLPWPDAHFDVVFCNHVVEHIPDDVHALESIRRVLKPGGTLILGVPNEGVIWWQMAYRLQAESLASSDHQHFYTDDMIRERAEMAGFEIEGMHYTGYGPPHWKWDKALRKYRRIDGLFEWLGHRLMRRQASSLYLVLKKPEKVKSHGVDVRLYEKADRKDWEKLVTSSPEAWLFHTREFIEMCVVPFDMREFSLVARKQGEAVGILPLNYSMREAQPKLGSLAFGPAGPALSPKLSEKERAEILERMMERALYFAREENCHALTAAIPPAAPARLDDQSGVSPLDALGFQASSTSSYVIDLRAGLDAVFAGFRSTVRNQIRRAEKADINIRLADQSGDLDNYYRIHCETYERTGVSPHPREYFEGIFTRMMPKGLCRIWVAEKDGAPLAFANIAIFKNSAYYWTGCGTDAGLREGANHLIQWHAIRNLAESGIEWYDVGEAFPAASPGDKEAGLDLFKRGFGGERRPFHKGRIDIDASPDKKPSRLRLSLYYMKKALQSLAGK